MECRLLIDNEDRHASNGATFERRGPTTKDVATVAAAATVDDAKAAADSARAAFPRWAALGPSARRSLLLHAAEELEKRTPNFIEAMRAAGLPPGVMNVITNAPSDAATIVDMSTERIVVHAAVADEFVRRLAAKARALPAGDPRERVVLGSLVGAEPIARIQQLLDDAMSQGATLAVRGEVKGTVMGARRG